MGSLAPPKHRKLNLNCVGLCSACFRPPASAPPPWQPEKEWEASFREGQGPAWMPIVCLSQTGQRDLPGDVPGASSGPGPGGEGTCEQVLPWTLCLSHLNWPLRDGLSPP